MCHKDLNFPQSIRLRHKLNLFDVYAYAANRMRKSRDFKTLPHNFNAFYQTKYILYGYCLCMYTAKPGSVSFQAVYINM